MNAQQLKNSILQEAIEGRLVPQAPNDEPASVLLDKIRKEKAKLVKEGKLKKKDLVEVPVGEDEKPFEIPESWEWCRLSDISACELGKALDAVRNTGEYVDYLTGINVYWNSFDFSQTRKMRMTDVEYSKYHINKGDLVVCEGGDAGRCAVWKSDKPIAFQKALHRVRFYSRSCPDFYMYLMMFYQYTNVLEPYITGTTIKHLTNVQLRNLVIPLPPLFEQRRIVAKIEELLPKVEEYGKAQEALDKLNAELPERLKKSILQEAIEGRLVPQDPHDEPASVLLDKIRKQKAKLVKEGKLKKKDLEVKPIEEDEVPFEIPESWAWFRLGDLANMYTGNSISETEKKAKYTNVEGMEYIGTKDVSFEHVIDYANGIAIPNQYVSGFKIAPEKSILLCVEGGSAGRKIGVLDRNVCFGNKLCCFDPFVEINKYLYYYLQSPLFKDIFKSKLNGIIGGVSINTMKSLSVPLPPLAEQRRIVAKIEELLHEIDKMKA